MTSQAIQVVVRAGWADLEEEAQWGEGWGGTAG
jgi:hypothetical protein